MIANNHDQTFPPEFLAEVEVAELKAIRAIGFEQSRPTTYDYYHGKGEPPSALAVRVEGLSDGERDKEFRPFRRNGSGFEMKAPDPRPLFRHEVLPEGVQRVLIVEGEKDVLTVEWLRRAVGGPSGEAPEIYAVTSMGGSSAADLTDWSFLPDSVVEAVILPDNDSPGEKYLDSVQEQIDALDRGITVKVVRLPDLPDAGDLSDFVTLRLEAFASRGGVVVEEAKSNPALRSKFAQEVVAELQKLIETGELGQEEEWPELLPLTSRPPYVPLSIELAFPQSLVAIRHYVESIAWEIQVHQDAVALMVMTAVSSTIGKKAEVLAYPPRGRERAPIWTYIAMEPGERKTSIMEELQKPMTDYSREWARLHAEEVRKNQQRLELLQSRVASLLNKAATAASPEKREEAEKGLPKANKELAEFSEEARGMLTFPVLSLQDATAEGLEIALRENDERMFMVSTEGGVIEATLSRYNKGVPPNLDVWLKGYDGEEHRTCRVSRGQSDLEPIIAVLVCSQTDILEAMMANPSAVKRGFVPRFSKIVPPSSVGHREISPAPCSEELRSTFQESMRRLLELPVPLSKKEGGPGAPVCHLGTEAKAAFLQFRTDTEKLLRDGHDLEDHKQWGSKLPGRVARFALSLHALSEWGLGGKTPESSPEISGETMRAAIAWAPFLIAGEKRAAAVARPDPVAEIAGRVLTWVRKNHLNEFSHREAFTARRCSEASSSKDFEPVLQRLEDTGYIRPLPPEKRSGAGRTPSPRFVVNPRWLNCDEPEETAQNAQNTDQPFPDGNSADSADSARGCAGPDPGPAKCDDDSFEDGEGLEA